MPDMTPADFRAAWRSLFSAKALHQLDEQKARAEYRRERGLTEPDRLPLSFYGGGGPDPPTAPALDVERLLAMLVPAVAAAVGRAVAEALAGTEQRVAAEVLTLLTAKNGNGHARRI